MKLLDKLDKLIESRDLSPKVSKVRSVPRPVVGPVQFATFDMLKDASKVVSKIEPDEDGIRKAVVRNIGLEQINLPMSVGRFIVDDIQKRTDGTYEVHFAEA
jgi:hypothetical protein